MAALKKKKKSAMAKDKAFDKKNKLTQGSPKDKAIDKKKGLKY